MAEEIKQKIDFLNPSTMAVEILGMVYYCESSRAWSVVRFKSRVFEEYPQLKKRRDKISYQMMLHKSRSKFLEEMKRIVKSGEELPITLRLFKLNQ